MAGRQVSCHFLWGGNERTGRLGRMFSGELRITERIRERSTAGKVRSALENMNCFSQATNCACYAVSTIFVNNKCGSPLCHSKPEPLLP